jgi:PIN domain nuclease of toxin-antitoxin system
MKILLDTHTFLWLVEGNRQLSSRAKTVLADQQNELVLSVASIWEMAIKVGLPNKPLILSEELGAFLDKWLPVYQVSTLPVSRNHALQVLDLPLHHKDPFDRLLIAQAIVEDMTILTADSHFSTYPVHQAW